MSEITTKAQTRDGLGGRDRLPLHTGMATRALLACGVAAGPVFIGVVAIQMVIRPGYDIARHPISLLSLGDLGWIQIANFVVSGLLALAFAVGMRRTLPGGRGGRWAPIFVGLFGLGTLAAGIFHPDPAYGFPPGAPAGTLPTISVHAVLHGVSFAVASVSLTVAAFIFARRFFSSGDARWGSYSLATGVAAPVLTLLGMSVLISRASILFAVVAILVFGWISAVALELLTSANNDG